MCWCWCIPWLAGGYYDSGVVMEHVGAVGCVDGVGVDDCAVVMTNGVVDGVGDNVFVVVGTNVFVLVLRCCYR